MNFMRRTRKKRYTVLSQNTYTNTNNKNIRYLLFQNVFFYYMKNFIQYILFSILQIPPIS